MVQVDVTVFPAPDVKTSTGAGVAGMFPPDRQVAGIVYGALLTLCAAAALQNIGPRLDSTNFPEAKEEPLARSSAEEWVQVAVTTIPPSCCKVTVLVTVKPVAHPAVP